MYSNASVSVIGNLGAAPILRYTNTGGRPVANFSVAVNKTFTNAAGVRVQDTSWFRCTAWDKQAEIAEEFLGKGSYVCVEGYLQNRAYDDRDGVRRFQTEIVATRIGFLDRNPNAMPVSDEMAPDMEQDELPFVAPDETPTEAPIAKSRKVAAKSAA